MPIKLYPEKHVEGLEFTNDGIAWQADSVFLTDYGTAYHYKTRINGNCETDDYIATSPAAPAGVPFPGMKKPEAFLLRDLKIS